MGRDDLAAALARRARSLPGQRTLGRLALRLRTSSGVRKVVSRAFDFDDSGIGGTVFLRAGHVIGGVGLDSLPVILVSLVDAPAEDVPELVDALAQEQLLTGGFRPVVVLDTDGFATVRQYGYPVDHVVARADWPGNDSSWQTYLTRRFQHMRRDYSAAGFVDLGRAPEAGLLFLRSLEPKE